LYLVELYEIIEDGESSTVEFKRKFSEPEKIAKEMIAFANTRGGVIIFGVDDNRDIVGVESEKGEIELIDSAAKFYCEPEIQYTYEIHCMKNKDIVVVSVPESKRKPHKLISDKIPEESRVYIRINDKSVIASKETVNLLKYTNPDAKPLMLSYGKLEKQLLEYLKDNERITVKEFKKLANISQRRASRTIVALVRAGAVIHHRQDDFEFYTLS